MQKSFLRAPRNLGINSRYNISCICTALPDRPIVSGHPESYSACHIASYSHGIYKPDINLHTTVSVTYYEPQENQKCVRNRDFILFELDTI